MLDDPIYTPKNQPFTKIEFEIYDPEMYFTATLTMHCFACNKRWKHVIVDDDD